MSQKPRKSAMRMFTRNGCLNKRGEMTVPIDLVMQKEKKLARSHSLDKELH